jgi:hypothetical protein
MESEGNQRQVAGALLAISGNTVREFSRTYCCPVEEVNFNQ